MERFCEVIRIGYLIMLEQFIGEFAFINARMGTSCYIAIMCRLVVSAETPVDGSATVVCSEPVPQAI